MSKKVFVFCIGGTGIRVMKSITMLMAGGMSTNGYTVVPVILDPHLDLEEKKNLHQLIDRYENIYQKIINDGKGTLNPLDGFFNSEIQSIDALGKLSGTDERFRQRIALSNLNNDDINHHFVNTLFSTKNLNNQLSVGFKGNPNVGTVVLGEMIENMFKEFKSRCEQDDRVFIISSIFGGTGASGYPLVERLVRGAENEPAVKSAVMGAVTVLPYYGLKDPETSGSDIDSANFYTKTKAALAYYQDTVQSDYLYYVGEKSLKQVYENNEQEQKDTANFIELVAATALFHFLQQPKPDRLQCLTRAIENDVDSLNLGSLGQGYSDVVKCLADYSILKLLVEELPVEKWFPLKKNRRFDDDFYKDAPFVALQDFTETFGQWYDELSNNNRAFVPVNNVNPRKMGDWVPSRELEAKDDSYYLLEMIEASNHCKEEHDNKFRYFMQFAYEAIDKYTQKIIQ